MYSEMYNGGAKTRMPLDPSRVQPGRAAKTAAVASEPMKRTRRPKGVAVETNLEAHLKEIVDMEEDQGTSQVRVPKKRPLPMAHKVTPSKPSYKMDKTTIRTPRKEKHEPYYEMKEEDELDDSDMPRRLTRRTLYLYDQLIQEFLKKLHIHSIPKKLPIQKVTRALEILDELKLNVLEPVVLINPHKERLNIIATQLATPIQNIQSPQEKQRLNSILKQFQTHGIDRRYLEELNRLIERLDSDYDINGETDIYGLYDEYKTRIQHIYARIQAHIQNLIGRVTEWRLNKLQHIGEIEDAKSKHPTKKQKEHDDLIISQYTDTLNLYTEYQSKCLTLLEHYEEEEQRFMTQHIDIYVKHDKNTQVNIFETQEIMNQLMNLRNMLNHFLESVQTAKQHTEANQKEVHNALDDILAMFGNKMFGGKKKRSVKKNNASKK